MYDLYRKIQDNICRTCHFSIGSVRRCVVFDGYITTLFAKCIQLGFDVLVVLHYVQLFNCIDKGKGVCLFRAFSLSMAP